MLKIDKMKIFIIIFIFLFISISLGYSFINSTLSSNNSVSVKKVNCSQSNLYERLSCMAVADSVESKFVSNPLGVDFSDFSSNTNGNGLYTLSSTLQDNYPIHYFRGNVNNNYVFFGDSCWKIFRTTDTGGIKLIYNGKKNDDNSCDNTSTLAFLPTMSKYNTNSTGSPAYAGYRYGKLYEKYVSTDEEKNSVATYGNDVTYANNKYTLNDTIQSTGTWANDYQNISDGHHYRCDAAAVDCEVVDYYFYVTDSKAFYIKLTDGEKVETAFEKMHENKVDSEIKTVVDNYFSEELNDLIDKIEDTPYCNDRKVYQYNGWSKDGNASDMLYYNSYNVVVNNEEKDLFSCDKKDAFTVSEEKGNGELTYPVGLITAPEAKLADLGYEKPIANHFLLTGFYYWTMTPDFVWDGNTRATCFLIWREKYIGSGSISFGDYGVRPVISLKNSIEIKSGSGVASDPYVVS